MATHIKYYRCHLALGGLLLCLTALNGCVKSSDIQHDQVPRKAESLGANAQFSAWPAQDWWLAFNDDHLNQLIATALRDSPSVAQAAKRVEQASAYAGAANAALKPQLSADLSINRQRLSENAFYPPPYGGSYQNIADGQFNASWDLDFWGKNRAGLNAALSQLTAAKADQQAARMLVSSSVARSYFQLARLLEQRRVAQTEVRQRTQVLALIQQRVEIGLDSNAELFQGQGTLPQARAQLEAVDESVALTRNALAALVAEPIDAVQNLQPPLPDNEVQTLPASVPADLIGRRPDLAASRARVEAATVGMNVARAEFYPNISLTAFLGLSSFGLSKFLETGSSIVGVGPAVHLPIFDGGALRANLKSRNVDLDTDHRFRRPSTG